MIICASPPADRLSCPRRREERAAVQQSKVMLLSCLADGCKPLEAILSWRRFVVCRCQVYFSATLKLNMFIKLQL